MKCYKQRENEDIYREAPASSIIFFLSFKTQVIAIVDIQSTASYFKGNTHLGLDVENGFLFYFHL